MTIDDLRESPSLTIIALLRKRGAQVEYNDLFLPSVGKGRKYALNMTSTELDRIPEFDCCVVIVPITLNMTNRYRKSRPARSRYWQCNAWYRSGEHRSLLIVTATPLQEVLAQVACQPCFSYVKTS